MNKNVKSIPVIQPYIPSVKSFMNYADFIWQNHQLSNRGPLVRELESKLCQKLRVPYVVTFANGHLALDSVLRALDFGSGEVITTPFTFISTTNALVMNGLKPIFCDIKPNDCTIDETKVEKLINKNTKAILAVHVYGFPCNYIELQRIADKYKIKLIYDAAHAFGVEVSGHGIGEFGYASMFSTHATKVFHTVEGGFIAFNDFSLTDKLWFRQNFGLESPELASRVGLNAKMSEMHAAMGLANLDNLDWQIAQRKKVVWRYLERLSQIKGIQLFNWDNKNILYNYAYFPVLFDETILGIDRNNIANKLAQRYNIFVRKYFYPLISDFECYSKEYDSNDTPVAKIVANRVLTLPLYVELTLEQVDYICDAILEILGSVG